MSFSIYADLTANIATWIARSDLTANIPDFITLFEAKAARKLRQAISLSRVEREMFEDLQYSGRGVG